MFRKLYKRVIWLCVLCSGMLMFNSFTVYASDEEYKTFIQNDPRWGNYAYGGGCTIGQYGCVITSLSVLMAYANPDLRDVNKWNPRIASQNFSFSGGSIYWGSTTNADPTFSLLNGSKYYSGSNLSEASARQKVKDLMNQGYYVIICATGLYTSNDHYSPVVGMDGDKPIVWDVAGGGKTWDDWSAKGINAIIAYESSLNPSTDVMGGTAESKVNEQMSPEKQEAAYSLIAEWELQGMPDESILLAVQGDIYPPTLDSLSLVEQRRVEEIKENIKYSKISLSEWYNKLFYVAGLGMLTYSVLLFIALLFDYANVFLEFSLLALLTFGRYRLVTDDYFETNKLIGYDKELKRVNVTPKMCVLRIVVIAVLGILILSGVVQYYVVFLLNFVKSIWQK